MPQFLEKLQSFSNVAAGQTTTLQIPVGLTYDNIQIVHNIADLTKAKNVRLTIDGKDVQTFKDFAEIKAINDYYDRKDQSGVCTIWFQHPENCDVTNRRAPSLGTADVSTFVLTVDLDASLVSPSLSASALKSNQDVMGLITKVKVYNATFGASGQVDIDNIVKAGRIRAIHLVKADITACVIEANGRKIHESTSALNTAVQKQAGRVPQSGIYTIDFCLEGLIPETFITEGIYDFRIRPTIGSAGAMRIVVEYYDAFAGM